MTNSHVGQQKPGPWTRWSRWSADNAAGLNAALLISLLLLGMVVGGLVQTRNTATQRTLDCVDEREAFAVKQSTFLRVKTQERDDAIKAKSSSVKQFAKATGEWTSILISALASDEEAPPSVVAEFLAATAKVQSSSAVVEQRADELAAASRALKNARDANPVVPPASELCKTGKFVPPAATPGPDDSTPPPLTATPEPTPRPTPTPKADESTGSPPNLGGPRTVPTPRAPTTPKATPRPTHKPSVPTPIPPSAPSPSPSPGPIGQVLDDVGLEDVGDLIESLL